MASKKELQFEIIKTYGVISEKTKGWKREINSVSWAGAEPKFDIRDWSPDHEKMGKGIALTEEEFLNLIDIAQEVIFSDSEALDNRELYELFVLPLRGFLDDYIKLSCYIDQDNIFKLKVGSNRVSETRFKVWHYDNLKVSFHIKDDN